MPARQTPEPPCVAVHQHANDDAAAKQHVREVVGAQLGDELRPRQRLEDVVGGHRQERVGEHQQRDGAFAVAQGDDSSEEQTDPVGHGCGRTLARLSAAMQEQWLEERLEGVADDLVEQRVKSVRLTFLSCPRKAARTIPRRGSEKEWQRGGLPKEPAHRSGEPPNYRLPTTNPPSRLWRYGAAG